MENNTLDVPEIYYSRMYEFLFIFYAICFSFIRENKYGF